MTEEPEEQDFESSEPVPTPWGRSVPIGWRISEDDRQGYYGWYEREEG